MITRLHLLGCVVLALLAGITARAHAEEVLRLLPGDFTLAGAKRGNR